MDSRDAIIERIISCTRGVFPIIYLGIHKGGLARSTRKIPLKIERVAGEVIVSRQKNNSLEYGFVGYTDVPCLSFVSLQGCETKLIN